jgi:hypothetical protein
MKKINVQIKTCNGEKGFFPIFEKDKQQLHNKKDGSTWLLHYKQSRNPKHHALVFALAKCCLNNIDDGFWAELYKRNNESAEYHFIKALMFDCGLTRQYYDINGNAYFEPRSISFENMDEDEFGSVSNIMFNICAKFLNIDENELRRNYIEYL